MRPSEQEIDFLRTVCEQVRWKRAHEVIRRDLADHIEDQTEAFMRENLSAAQASERAVAEMGDPVTIGLQMDACYRPRLESRVIAPLALLVLSGVLLRVLFHELTSAQWGEYLLALALGSACFLLMLRLNFYKLTQRAWLLFGGFLLLTAVLPLLWMRSIRTGFYARRAYDVIQSLWLLFPVLFAPVVYRMRGSGFFGLVICGLLFCVPMLLRTGMFYAPNTYEIVPAIAGFAVVMSAIRKRCFRPKRVFDTIFASAVTVVGTVLAFLTQAQAVFRFISVCNPYRDPLGRGWETLSIREILANSNALGQGGALSAEAQRFLSETQGIGGDYLLTHLIYRYGFVAALPPVLAVSAFLVFGYVRTRRIRSTLGKLLAVGILTIFSVQTMLYIIPCVGYPFLSSSCFPFVSDGNAMLVLDLLLSGLLLSLFRTDPLFTDTAHKSRRLRIRFE